MARLIISRSRATAMPWFNAIVNETLAGRVLIYFSVLTLVYNALTRY